MNYNTHDFKAGDILKADQLNDMDNAIKELADGGSGGGLQLEQIGTTHNCKWLETENGQLKISYYRIGGEGSCLFGILIDGAGQGISFTGMKGLDDSPNVTMSDVIPASSSFGSVGGLVTDTNNQSVSLYVGINGVGNKALVLRNITNTSVTVNSLKGFILFIGKLADNIT